jgi:sortase system peptidoglycan-associated protein
MNLKTNITKQIVTGTALIAMSALGTQALAADTDTRPEERRGVVVGGIVGASVGGPIGAGIGAIIGGGWIGKAVGIHRINRELTAELAAAEDEVRETKQKEMALAREVTYLQDALTRTEAVAKAAPEMPIQFRTASSDIADHYQDKLKEIAAAVAKRPDARVKLHGFADRRGAEDYNLKLSQERVAEVRQFLEENGVPASRIETSAYGESQPVSIEQSSETDFFDRRVVMQFELVEDETPLAAR